MLRLDFSPSYGLAGGLIVAHAAALFAVWIIDWPLWLKIAVSATLLASCGLHVRRNALLWSPRSVTALLLKSDGRAEAMLRNGTTMVGMQTSGSFVHPWFTSIIWRPQDFRFSRAIGVLPDSLPAEQFRELRVWLKWRRMKKAES